MSYDREVEVMATSGPSGLRYRLAADRPSRTAKAPLAGATAAPLALTLSAAPPASAQPPPAPPAALLALPAPAATQASAQPSPAQSPPIAASAPLTPTVRYLLGQLT